ncbi:hypothetical protein OAT84_03550 [Gammaproteobacteria bacterium]|nr:hypothetical protein [Gammaproteobacteria bacterium]
MSKLNHFYKYFLPLMPFFVLATCGQNIKGTIGEVLCLVKANILVGILILIYGASMIIGMGLLVAGIFKLKQVKDNPTQIPISTPGAFFIAGALLLFIPNVFPVVRESVFGAGTASSNNEGKETTINIVGLMQS